MMDGYTDLLTDPRTFFERELEDASVLLPALVVLLVGALSAVTTWINFQRQSEFLQRAAEENVTETAQGVGALMTAFGVITVVFAFVMAFVAWLYYAGFTFGLSALLDGEGDFPSTLAVIGWGFVPKLFELVLQAIGTWYVTITVDLPQNTVQAPMQAYSGAVQSHPVNIALILVGILVLLWSAYIWYEGLQVARRLDSREALIAVAIPAGLILLTRLLGLVNALGAL
jgi:hypothetical protein